MILPNDRTDEGEDAAAMDALCEDRLTAPLSAYGLRRATEAAARAAADWIGRGDKAQGDQAAIRAMAAQLRRLGVDGVLVVGEGAPEEFDELYTGERFGAGEDGAAPCDIAVDPVEGTSYLARGMTNAMAVVAMAPRGALFDPGPAFYMEKFAGPPAVKGRIDPDAPLEDKLAVLAECLGKPVGELTVYVLEKPRHRDLVARLHAAGVRVALYPAGDVAGAVAAALPESGIDALMGTGGIAEGVLSACAIRALGGEFMGRLDPQLATEARAVAEAGMDTRRWLALEEIVRSDAVVFCATGITTGLLFEGVMREPGGERTQTLMLTGPAGERQMLTTWHRS